MRHWTVLILALAMTLSGVAWQARAWLVARLPPATVPDQTRCSGFS